jgi:aspartate aminotransferase
MGERVAELRRAGVEIFNLAVGEPDLDTPQHIREAAKQAIDAGLTRYTPTRGLGELCAGTATWLATEHQIEVLPEQVIVGAGAKHSLYTLLQVLLEEGDEVVVLRPAWPSYADLISLAGGRTVYVSSRAEDGFIPDPGAVRRAFTARTKAVIVSSPGNPTGAVYPQALLEELALLCVEKGAFVITDDIYRAFHYQGRCPSAAHAARSAGAKLAIVDGISKSYCMTGWRIGFTVASREIVSAMATLQSHMLSCVSSVSQAAALAAISGPQDCLDALRTEFGARRRLVVERLRQLPRVRLAVDPPGAFYAFPDLSGWMGARTPAGAVIGDDVALTEYLLESAHVAVNPGSPFGAPSFLRLSYGASRERLNASMTALEGALRTLTAP